MSVFLLVWMSYLYYYTYLTYEAEKWEGSDDDDKDRHDKAWNQMETNENRTVKIIGYH
jgi:hypothetical protein